MVAFTIETIREKIRRITASSEIQIDNTQLDFIIQQYWQSTFPAEARPRSLTQEFSFLTKKGKAIYSLPSSARVMQPMAFCDGIPLVFYGDESTFLVDEHARNFQTVSLGVGDGQQQVFEATLSSFPVLDTLVIFTGEQQIYYSSQVGGSISYNTSQGTLNVVFEVPPTEEVFCKYQMDYIQRPQSILVLDNIRLFPTPDSEYLIQISGCILPKPLPISGEIEISQDFFNLIAYGCALELFLERGDFDSYHKYIEGYDKYMQVAMSKTYQELKKAKPQPCIFS